MPPQSKQHSAQPGIKVFNVMQFETRVQQFAETKIVKLNKAVQTDPVEPEIIETIDKRNGDKTMGKYYIQAIKIDALWKPIIRKFRQHIKQKTLSDPRARMRWDQDEAA